MSATVILTRKRPDVGFKYLAPMWNQMASTWANAIAVRPFLAPSILLDASGLTPDVVAEHEGELRALVGPGIQIRTQVGPRPLNGNRRAYWCALELAHELAAPEALVVEDDVEWCGNGYLRALTFPMPPDLDIVAFFAPHVFQTSKMWAGLWRTPAPLGSTACLKFRRAALATILSKTPDLAADVTLLGAVGQSDQALEMVRRAQGLRWGAHCPELVQHVGEVSNNGPDEDVVDHRYSRTWSPRLDGLAFAGRHDLFT